LGLAHTTRSRLLYGKLPREVEAALSATHIEKIWTLLEERFCFNVKLWKKDFHHYYQQQPRSVSMQEAFVEFGAEFINPILNTVLKRDHHHATWSNILKYVVKKH
jgi:hypothetical protein